MISHVTLGADDIDAAARFYDAVLGTLGLVRRYTFPDGLGYGPMEGDRLPSGASAAQLWIMKPYDGGKASFGNGTHVALLAPDRASVDAFYDAALERGGRDEGGPGLRPHYHAQYYAAYIRDPLGNKLQAVHHGTHGDVIG
jgi:catechol 2,3-dioxygenase-like lactoylglutathione lyase family enzyme